MTESSPSRRPIDLAGPADYQGPLILMQKRHRLFNLLLGPDGEVPSAARWAEHPAGGDGRAELDHLADRLREALTLTVDLAKTG